VADLGLLEKAGAAVVGIVRAGGEGTLLAPGPYNRIRSDDTLILQGEPEALVRLRAELGLKQRDSRTPARPARDQAAGR
jgi:K+/H+ antiporter YhaU regulatory subunit KhtT